MTFTLYRTSQVTGGGTSLTATQTYAYSGNPRVSDSIANGTVSVDCVFKYANLTFIGIFASGALTLQAKTSAGVNNGSPITVSATQAFLWGSDEGSANPFSADIATFEVVNATGSSVTLNIETLVDATP